jgi:hypothetical protein
MRKFVATAFMTVIQSSLALAQAVTTPFSLTTNGCSEPSTMVHQICLPAGREIQDPPSFSVDSSAGSSTYTWSYDPNQKNCIVVTLNAVPQGEDCANLGFTKVCNCKGRGWISIHVTLQPKQ